MSEGRELLESCLDEFQYQSFPCTELVTRIKELLAKPKQEPVAWMNDSGGCFLSDGNKYSEQWTPLYASPKLECINHDDILDRTIDGSFEYRDGFMDGVMFAENHHGIGGGE